MYDVNVRSIRVKGEKSDEKKVCFYFTYGCIIVELNGNDYFSGYFILENEDGEIVAEDNEAFARLGQ